MSVAVFAGAGALQVSFANQVDCSGDGFAEILDDFEEASRLCLVQCDGVGFADTVSRKIV